MKDNSQPKNNRSILLIYGIVAPLLYIILNIVAAMMYKGYDAASQTVSELSAIGAPTRTLWVVVCLAYSVLMFVFGFGVWQAGSANRNLRIAGIIFAVDAVIGFLWPPMHQREVLAAGGGNWSDTMHIIFTIVAVPLMILAIVFGARAFAKSFRIYSIITLLILIAAGVMTGIGSPNIPKNLPTPFIGIWERINITVYMAWVAVLAIALLKRHDIQTTIGNHKIAVI